MSLTAAGPLGKGCKGSVERHEIRRKIRIHTEVAQIALIDADQPRTGCDEGEAPTPRIATVYSPAVTFSYGETVP